MNLSDYDDNISDDEDIFRPEIGAFERVGLPGARLGTLDPTGRVDHATQDPLERFQIYVDAISRNLIGQEVKLDEDNIQKMLEKAIKLKHVNYKNPNAYVLGFIASNGGSNITKKGFDYSVSVLPFLTGGNVLPPDILRYARLWLSL